MATEPGWFYQWFADNWFPPVWFAPADESAVPPEELRPGGGAGMVRPRKPRRPAWVIPPKLIKPRRLQRDEDEALLLCDAL